MAKEKILIVEDDKDIRELIRYNLEREGYSTLLAENGERALTLVKNELPRLVILDLMLPDVDGLDVCKIIRHGDQTKHIPIIILTAKSEDSDVIVGLQLGADDYVTKPFSPNELAARVKTVLLRTKQTRG